MKKIWLIIQPYVIVLGTSTIIVFSSLKLAGASDYFAKYNVVQLNFPDSDSVKFVVSAKGKKEWRFLPKIKY